MYLKSPFPELESLPDGNAYWYIFKRPDQNAWRDYTVHIDSATGKRRTFSRFLARVNDAITALGTPVSQGGLGLRGEDGEIIGIMDDNSMDYITLINACLAITTPLALISSYSTAFELKHALTLSKTTRLFIHSKHLPLVLSVTKDIGIPADKIYILDGPAKGHRTFDGMIDDVRSKGMLPVAVRPAERDTLAYLVFSSGTSGLPKAVMISHGNIIYSLAQYKLVQTLTVQASTPPALKSPEGIPINLAFLPLHHTYGLHTFAFRAFITPVTLVFLPRWSIEAALGVIKKYNVTTLSLVPSVIQQLVTYPHIHKADLSSVAAVHSGAAYLAPELRSKMAKIAPKNARIAEGYGMSETTMTAIVEPQLGVLGRRHPHGSTGILFPGMEARIVRDDGTEADFNEPGELWLKGPIIALGYWNNEKVTKETFVDGWLHTGDKFLVDSDQNFFFADRAKDTLKVSGSQVSPVEIEDVLLAHPQKLITDACVAGVSGGRTSDEKVPRAWVSLSPVGKKLGATASIRELEIWHRKNLSKYKWLRGGIEIVDQIPKSPTGKTLRRVLQDKYEESVRKLQSKL